MNISPEALALLPVVREALERQTIPTECLCGGVEATPKGLPRTDIYCPRCDAHESDPDPQFAGLLEVVRLDGCGYSFPRGWVGMPQGALAGAVVWAWPAGLPLGPLHRIFYRTDDADKTIMELLLQAFPL